MPDRPKYAPNKYIACNYLQDKSENKRQPQFGLVHQSHGSIERKFWPPLGLPL
jgi:hypothetical protein